MDRMGEDMSDAVVDTGLRWVDAISGTGDLGAHLLDDAEQEIRDHERNQDVSRQLCPGRELYENPMAPARSGPARSTAQAAPGSV